MNFTFLYVINLFLYFYNVNSLIYSLITIDVVLFLLELKFYCFWKDRIIQKPRNSYFALATIVEAPKGFKTLARWFEYAMIFMFIFIAFIFVAEVVLPRNFILLLYEFYSLLNYYCLVVNLISQYFIFKSLKYKSPTYYSDVYDIIFDVYGYVFRYFVFIELFNNVTNLYINMSETIGNFKEYNDSIKVLDDKLVSKENEMYGGDSTKMKKAALYREELQIRALDEYHRRVAPNEKFNLEVFNQVLADLDFEDSNDE